MKDKLNTGLGYVAWIGDYVIAALGGVFVAGRNVRDDIMAPENIDKPVDFFKSYKKHFVKHVKNHNNDKLSVRAFSRYMKDVDTYNPYTEINEKNLGDIVKKMENAYSMSVTYFEKTEHQRHTPQRCSFDDYLVFFAPDGTKWCGGIRGNGYVYKRNAQLGHYTHLAEFSPQLSDYLAEMVMKRAK